MCDLLSGAAVQGQTGGAGVCSAVPPRVLVLHLYVPDVLLHPTRVVLHPECRNCPECKLRPDVMQLADMEAAFDLCQRLYACAICACK